MTRPDTTGAVRVGIVGPPVVVRRMVDVGHALVAAQRRAADVDRLADLVVFRIADRGLEEVLLAEGDHQTARTEAVDVGDDVGKFGHDGLFMI